MASTLLDTRHAGMTAIGVSRHRSLDGAQAVTPEGTVIVSADNHWGLAEDPWKGRVPTHLVERVPSVWWDEARSMWNLGVGGKPVFDGYVAEVFRSVEDRAGTSRITERMADLDADGIDMEIVFPQVLLMYCRHPDLEAREWIFRAYNEYLAEVGARAPGRFFGVGFVNFWDPSKAAESIRQVVDLGLKTYVLPINPGVDKDGRAIHYASAEMEPLWAAADEAGLPVYFHVGESLNLEPPGGIAAATLGIFMPFRKNFSELVFGGILDRYPRLRVVFAEAGINWIPGMLQDAEMIVDSFHGFMNPTLKMRPTDYWRRNCYATFMTDNVGLKMLDYVGADRLLWAADYPHNEGTLGYTRAVVEEVVKATTPAEARMILGGTARSLFDLV